MTYDSSGRPRQKEHFLRAHLTHLASSLLLTTKAVNASSQCNALVWLLAGSKPPPESLLLPGQHSFHVQLAGLVWSGLVCPLSSSPKARYASMGLHFISLTTFELLRSRRFKELSIATATGRGCFRRAMLSAPPFIHSLYHHRLCILRCLCLWML